MRFLLLFLLGLILVGCGGSGASNGGGQLVPRTITSSIQMPGAARGLALDSMTVFTAAKRSPVDAQNRSKVVIFNEGPQYAELDDSQGRVVLTGFLSPGSPNLSARSTAVALTYLAVAGGWMKEAGRITVLENIETLAGFPELEGAVESQIAADGYLDLDNKNFQAALETVVGGVLQRFRGIIVEPTKGSGISLDTTVSDKLSIENVYLRRVQIFMRRTGYKTADGKVVDEDNTPWTQQDMKLVSRYGGITGTIDSYIKGEVAYSPVRNEPPLDIPRFPGDARETYYQVNVIGPGFTGGPSYDSLPTEQQVALQELEIKALFLDAFLPLLANVALPLKGDQVDAYLEFAAANGVITDIIGTLRSTLPELGSLMGEGKYWDATKLLITSVYTSNTILPLVGQMTLDFLRANSGLNNLDLQNLQGGMKTLLDMMGKVDVGFTLADTALLFHDYARSNKAEIFRITTTKGKITLQADRTTIRPTQTTKIRAIIQDRDPDGTYEFVWTVQPNNNYWVEDRHLNGTDDNPEGILTTLEEEVNIRSFINTNGEALVKCRVFRLDGGRREVDDDEITITFDVNAQNVVVTVPTLATDTKITQLLDGGYSPSFIIYYQFPKPTNGGFFTRVIGESPNIQLRYNRQWYEPRADPLIRIVPISTDWLTPPPANTYKVIVRYSSSGIVGGFSTIAQAQAWLDGIVPQTLESYRSQVTHRIEVTYPDN